MGVTLDARPFVEPHSSMRRTTDEKTADLCKWLNAYDKRIDSLAEELDEQWILWRFDQSLLLPWRRSTLTRRRLLIVAMLGASYPTIEGLQNPVNRLALLPTEQLHWVLRARALYARATALRRCVDGQLIDRVAAMLGPCGANVVRQISSQVGITQNEDLTLFAQTEPAAWSHDGMVIFEKDGAWSDPVLEGMIRLALPPDTSVVDRTRVKGQENSSVFLRCVANFYPDMSWLFG